jgi:16S rRNA processing protein RimM
VSRRPDPRFLSDDVRLGSVSGVHGVRGEVKVFLYNPGSDLVDRLEQVTLVGPDGQRKVVAIGLRSGAGQRILAAIDGVSDREHARALEGWELVIAPADLPPAEQGSWYHRDLLGLPVRTVSGRELGRIAEIHDTGEVDVWLLRGPAGERVLPVLLRNLVLVRVGPGGEVVVTEDAVDDQPPV